MTQVSQETMMFKRNNENDARTKLRRFERYELIEELVVKYLEKNTK